MSLPAFSNFHQLLEDLNVDTKLQTRFPAISFDIQLLQLWKMWYDFQDVIWCRVVRIPSPSVESSKFAAMFNIFDEVRGSEAIKWIYFQWSKLFKSRYGIDEFIGFSSGINMYGFQV